MEKQISAYDFIMLQIHRAQGSKGYFPREAFYEAKGMMEMAYSLKAITKEEFFELDSMIVRNGINNPEYFN